MKRLVLTAIAATACWGLFGQRAQAQIGFYTRPQTSPFYRPPVSPYLNLLRGGPLGPATGYYTLTRPQFEAFGQLQQLQGDLLGLQALQQASLLQGAVGNPTGLAATPLPPTAATGAPITGHPVRFFSLSPYYGGFPGTAGTGGAPLGGATFGRAPDR